MKSEPRSIYYSCAVFLCCLLSRKNCRATSLLTEATVQAEALQEHQLLRYGVDVSFPMHHNPPDGCEIEKEGYNQESDKGPLDQFTYDRLHFYHNHFLEGCKAAFGEDNCIRSEKERIEMSKRQPATMRNMTKGLGFHKMKVPKDVFDKILEFWHTNQHESYTEEWPAGSSYVNHWESLPSVVRVDNATLEGGGYELTQTVWDSLHPIVSEWTGQELQEASIYGVRIYHSDAVLSTHVDRNPLVSSAIINVAQDVDEPWPLEVIGHDGFAYNVTMEPGDLVLYESHSILHGRPFPLQGRFMANLFIHFEPVLPDAKPNAVPVYRKKFNQSKKKCTPVLKNGHIVCEFQREGV